MKTLVLQLEFKVIPPEFPAPQDLFAELVGFTIYLIIKVWLEITYIRRDRCLLSLPKITGKHLAV